MHFLLRQPFALIDKLALHLANEGHRPAEPEEAEAKEVRY
jgi:hypothetical protein